MTRDVNRTDGRTDSESAVGDSVSADDPGRSPLHAAPYFGDSSPAQVSPTASTWTVDLRTASTVVDHGYPLTGRPLSGADARLWSTLAHVAVIPTAFVGPLIIWALFKDRDRLVGDNALSATNFGFLLGVGYLAGSILTVILIGALMLPVIFGLAVIFGIIGAVKAGNGEVYAYPVNVRWLS